MRVIILISSIMILYSCKSITPIVIKEPPRAEMREGMTVDEYLYESTRYKIEVEAYIAELLGQIKHKVPYIDLRTAGAGVIPRAIRQKEED